MLLIYNLLLVLDNALAPIEGKILFFKPTRFSKPSRFEKKIGMIAGLASNSKAENRDYLRKSFLDTSLIFLWLANR